MAERTKIWAKPERKSNTAGKTAAYLEWMSERFERKAPPEVLRARVIRVSKESTVLVDGSVWANAAYEWADANIGIGRTGGPVLFTVASETAMEAALVSLLAAERAGRAASTLRFWNRIGFFLPSRSKAEILGPVLAEHASDLFEALVNARSQGKQNLLVLRFTIAAFGKVLDCIRVGALRRLRDEFEWVTGKLTQR